jgi:hypothetical protein
MNSQTQPLQLTAGGSLPNNVPMNLSMSSENIQSVTVDNYSSCTVALYPNQSASGLPLFLVQPYTYKTVTALNEKNLTAVFQGSISQNGYCFLEWDDNENATPQQGSLQAPVSTGALPYIWLPGTTITAEQFGLDAIRGLTILVDNVNPFTFNATDFGIPTVIPAYSEVTMPILATPGLISSALSPTVVVAVSSVALPFSILTIDSGSGTLEPGLTPNVNVINTPNVNVVPNPIPGTPFGPFGIIEGTPWTVPANKTLYVSGVELQNRTAAAAEISVNQNGAGMTTFIDQTIAAHSCYYEPFNPPMVFAAGIILTVGGPATVAARIDGFTIP